MNTVLFSCAPRAPIATLLVCAALLCAATAAQAAVTISTKATNNMSCTGGVCTPTAPKANLNVTDLANMLAAGNVTVESDSATKDIEFKAPLSWTATSRLTLDSYRSIVFQQPITVAGIAALTIATNDGGSNGDFWFEKRGHVEFWDLKSSLAINGNSYTLVRSIRQLAGAVATNPAGAYALAKDYNASKDGSYAQSPVTTTFTGTFEALGHTIRGLRISTHTTVSSLGLFALVNTGGVLRDLNIIDSSISSNGEADVVGLVAGRTYGTTVDNVNASGTVDAGCCEAGEYGLLIGWSSEDVIAHTSSSGSVIGTNGVGGLIGEIAETELSWSHSTTNVTSSFGDAGGLLGTTYTSSGAGSVDHCFATGIVTGTGGVAAGGLIGSSRLSVKDSFATGTVGGDDSSKVGGLIGDGGQVTNSYATGAVTGGGNSTVGGLLGNGGYGARSSYSTGAVLAGTESLVGGFVGYDYTIGSTFRSSYWDLDTSGITDPNQGAGNTPNAPGIKGLGDSQLKAALPKGFDPKVWGQSATINNGYPYLLANPPPK